MLELNKKQIKAIVSICSKKSDENAFYVFYTGNQLIALDRTIAIRVEARKEPKEAGVWIPSSALRAAAAALDSDLAIISADGIIANGIKIGFTPSTIEFINPEPVFKMNRGAPDEFVQLNGKSLETAEKLKKAFGFWDTEIESRPFPDRAGRGAYSSTFSDSDGDYLAQVVLPYQTLDVVDEDVE